jgi:phage portal protein BeeE
VLPGATDIKLLNWAPRETLQTDLEKLTREEIMLMFGVPPTFGDVVKARAEVDGRMVQYMTHAIVPRVRRFEQRFNMDICPIYDPTGRLFVMFDDVVPRDRQLLLDERKGYVDGGILTRNEVRSDMGYEPIEGGDQLLVNASMVALDQVAVSSEEPYAGGLDDGEPDGDED